MQHLLLLLVTIITKTIQKGFNQTTPKQAGNHSTAVGSYNAALGDNSVSVGSMNTSHVADTVTIGQSNNAKTMGGIHW